MWIENNAATRRTAPRGHMGSELAEVIIDHIAEADPELAGSLRRAGAMHAFREGETLRVEVPHWEVEMIAQEQDHGAERLYEGFREAAAGMGVPWRYVER